MKIISHWQQPIDLSNLEYQDDDLHKSWANGLSLKTYERREYLGFKWTGKSKAETVGIYFSNNTPQYIHRRLIKKPAFHWLVTVGDWILMEYQKVEDAKKKQAHKAQMAFIKKAIEIKTQKTERICESMAESWLKHSKHNIQVWKESFEPIENEEDKLLTLMNKKMLD